MSKAVFTLSILFKSLIFNDYTTLFKCMRFDRDGIDRYLLVKLNNAIDHLKLLKSSRVRGIILESLEEFVSGAAIVPVIP